MSTQLRSLLEVTRSWSRAMQWAFWALVFTVAFLVWDTTIADLGDSWSAQADAYEQQIMKVNKPTTLTTSVKNAITSFGEVEIPRKKTAGATAMTEAVHTILSSHGVSNDEYTRTKTSRMRSGSLPGIGGVGESIEQVIGDIRFESTQEKVLGVIAALESSPWIDAVSDVRLTRQDGRMIQVDLSVEAWVVTTKQKRGGR